LLAGGAAALVAAAIQVCGVNNSAVPVAPRNALGGLFKAALQGGAKRAKVTRKSGSTGAAVDKVNNPNLAENGSKNATRVVRETEGGASWFVFVTPKITPLESHRVSCINIMHGAMVQWCMVQLRNSSGVRDAFHACFCDDGQLIQNNTCAGHLWFAIRYECNNCEKIWPTTKSDDAVKALALQYGELCGGGKSRSSACKVVASASTQPTLDQLFRSSRTLRSGQSLRAVSL
jgi:hypothetical protein